MLVELVTSILGGIIGGLIVCGLLYIFKYRKQGE